MGLDAIKPLNTCSQATGNMTLVFMLESPCLSDLLQGNAEVHLTLRVLSGREDNPEP
jgi:hypothetical protein